MEMFNLKMIVGGFSGVGKSSFINKLCTDEIDRNIKPTLILDIKNTEIKFSDKLYKIEIWDCAGQDEFTLQNKNFFKDSNIIILIFDLTEMESFNKLNNWMEKINEVIDLDKTKVLVFGNKNDLESKIEKNLIDEFIKEKKIFYEEISVYLSTKKELENKIIKHFFDDIGQEEKKESIVFKKPEEKKHVKLASKNKKEIKKKKGCC